MEGKEQDAKEKGPVSDDISEIVKDSVNLRRKDMAQWSTNDLARRVVDGKSFVNTGDEEEQLWWHASEPHGTQMARLICSMDPCCELYVVKVAETRSSGISANVVAEVRAYSAVTFIHGLDLLRYELIYIVVGYPLGNQQKRRRHLA